MTTRQEIDDFIREDESGFSDEREPLCTCDNCGDGIFEDDEMAVVEAMQIAGEHMLTEQRRYKQIIGTAVNMGLASIGKGAAT